MSRAKMREPAERRQQTERAYEDIAIQHHQTLERGSVEEGGALQRRQTARSAVPQQRGAEHEAERVGRGRGRANAGHTPIEYVHIQQHRRDVHAVDEHL